MIAAPSESRLPLIRRILIAIGKAVLFTVLCIVFTLGLSLPIGKLLSPEQTERLAEGITADAPVWILNLTYLIVCIAAFLALLIVRKAISGQALSSAGLGTKAWLREFGEGWLLGAGLVLTGYLLLVVLGLARSEGWYFALPAFTGWFILFLIQPFVEELLFRGYLMSLLMRYFNLRVALIVSSVAFALVHGANEGFSSLAFLTITVAGFLFGLLFLKTGQLWLATGMHAAWNFTQGVICGFPTSGIRTYAITQTTTSGPDWLSGGSFGFEGSILAILLILAAGWWYRKSIQDEQLSPVIRASFHRDKPVTIIDALRDEEQETL